MTRRGRPRADEVQLRERVAGLLASEPGLSANYVVRRVNARRGVVLRVVRAIRAAESAGAAPACPEHPEPDTPPGSRFPYSRSACQDGVVR